MRAKGKRRGGPVARVTEMMARSPKAFGTHGLSRCPTMAPDLRHCAKRKGLRAFRHRFPLPRPTRQ